MNFVKRAALSLWARKSRTLITLATFLAISVMVLAGVLIDHGTARAEQSVKRSVGAEVDLNQDLSKIGAGSGGGFQAPSIAAATVDKIGALPQVQSYTYTTFDRAFLSGGATLVAGGPPSPGGANDNSTMDLAVRDSSGLPNFRSGQLTLVSGAPIGPADHDKHEVLIEERLAEKNHLRVGDKLTLIGNDEKTTAVFTVSGIFRDSRATSDSDPDYEISPANMLYTTLGGLTALGSESDGPLSVSNATFILRDADAQNAFKAGAKQVAGSALDPFSLDVNTKAIQQMTGPLGSIRGTATLAMWLMALAGAAVLALLANLAVKQRRKEYGVLLAMGEKKSKLIGQQILEIAAVAILAVGLSSLIAPGLTQSAGQWLLGRDATAAKQKIAAWKPPPPGSTGLGQGIDPNDQPVPNADPVDKITVALDPANLLAVGGVGLGIGLLATAIPATALLRLSPRTILTKGK
ncbi:ABC transporter permease [Catenulispora pinisilvae]|uniref:ABC transporter permease n=1 Tax=Catenulispora pinisilvae TaxID=2705253 RepID=UPI001890B8AE|nr:FtsX-like permease family protein [Catenulispora pinisilvae]